MVTRPWRSDIGRPWPISSWARSPLRVGVRASSSPLPGPAEGEETPSWGASLSAAEVRAGRERPGTRVTLCPHGRHRTRGWGSGLVSHAAVVWVSRWGSHAAESRGRGGFPAVESFQQQGGVGGPVLCGASGHHLRVRVGPQPGRSEPRKRAADVPRGAPTPPPAAGAARAQQVPGVGC